MSGQTLRVLESVLLQGHKLGIGVYTNSKTLMRVIEDEFGLPCTLVSIGETGAERHCWPSTMLLMLDDVELFDHKPKPLELNNRKAVYWNLYDTRTVRR
jgi:hypothetical protein